MVVELALLLPFLVFLFLVTVDFARVYYFSQTVQNSARVGVLFASDPHVAHESPFANFVDAALADAKDLNPTPTVTKHDGTDSEGRPYVTVSVAYPYRTITGFPGLPNVINLKRSVRMYYAAIVPD